MRGRRWWMLTRRAATKGGRGRGRCWRLQRRRERGDIKVQRCAMTKEEEERGISRKSLPEEDVVAIAVH